MWNLFTPSEHIQVQIDFIRSTFLDITFFGLSNQLNKCYLPHIIVLFAGPVLSLAVAPDGDYCFSGGIDATIRCWNMPHSTVDPYDSYGKRTP